MNHIPFFFSQFAQILGYALVYSLWQAFIVSLCLKIILKFIPDVSARIKYSLSYFAYAVIALWFIVTLFIQAWNIKNQLIASTVLTTDLIPPVTFQTTINSSFPGISFSILNNYFPFITAFYLFGLTCLGIKLVLNYFQTTRLKSKALSAIEEKWQLRILQLCKRLQIRKRVRTFYSNKIETPVMIGFFQPVILLPFATLSHLSVEQFEAILLHELAHIHRNDYFFNLLQSLLDTILFFNPFTWWITKKIRVEREKCCDEMVLEISDPHLYAHALLELQEPVRSRALLMTAVGKHSQLLHRIKNIMEMKNKHINFRQKAFALLIFIAGFVSVAWLSPKGAHPTSNDRYLPPLKNSFLLFNESAPSFGLNNFPYKAYADTAPIMIPIPPVMPPTPAIVSRQMTAPATPPPPPLPTAQGILPAPPPPPVPPLPLIKNDTFPPMNSYFNSKEWKKQQEEIRKSSLAMKKYFQSDAWKKQQQLIKKNALALNKYFNSAEWKKQQTEIQKNAMNIDQYFNSPEWKKQEAEIQKNAMNVDQYFNRPEWKKHQEEMKKDASRLNEYFESPQWKKQQELIRKSADSVAAFFKSETWKKQ